MQIGDLVRNNYKEVGTIIEEWGVNLHLDERQWYVLYTDGRVAVTSEYDLEVVCK